jgi:hypothetical protein
MTDPSAAEPPGCLVILTALSAAMAEDVRLRLGHRTLDDEPWVCELPREFAARFLVDELLEGLVVTLQAGYPVPLDVAVVGYSAGEDGRLRLVSLLAGEEAPPRLVPLAEVADRPVECRRREGEPRKWTVAAPCQGTAPAAAALAEVYRLVSVWLTGRYTARPPVVLHCTAGEGLDDHYRRVARSLGLLVTSFGPARLLHVGFTPDVEPTLCGQWPGPAPEPWHALFEVSAELPAEPDGRPARRAVSVNDWSITDAWSAIFDRVPVEDPTPWTAPDTARFEPDTARGMWAQKLGNTPDQWEDAFASDPVAGVAAVADGASSGIFCRTWADQLARRFVLDRPDLRDPVTLAHWVNQLRSEWRAAINYPKLNWAQQRKVDDVGAAATLLGLEVGPLAADGHRPWRAAAVGDACLFWLRDGQLLGSFPVVAHDQFGSAPLLIRSNPGYKTLALAAAGLCRPGDVFVLATDAVAARLFRSTTHGPGPDWDGFETIPEGQWRADLDALRRGNDMVNDDCTLLTLRVAGREPRSRAPLAEPSPVGSSSAEPSPVEPPAPVGAESAAPCPPASDEPADTAEHRPLTMSPLQPPAAGAVPPPAAPTADPEQKTRDGFSDPTAEPV